MTRICNNPDCSSCNGKDDQVYTSPFTIKLGRITKLLPAIAKQDANVVDVLPVHEVDRDGCNGSLDTDDVRSANLAHDLFEAFAWVEWVSVQRMLNRFIVKVKHSYPVDVRPELRAWLEGHTHVKKWNATFELQVKAIELEP